MSESGKDGKSLIHRVTTKTGLLPPSKKIMFGATVGLTAGIASGNHGLTAYLDKVIGTEVGALAALSAVIKDSRHLDNQFGDDRHCDLGEYGTITLRHHQGQSRTLQDGTIVKHGDVVGQINLIKNTNAFKDYDPITATNLLFHDFLLGMYILADDINNHRFPKEVVALTGTSHLASKKLMEKLGFKAEVPDLISKTFATLYGVARSQSMGAPEKFSDLYKKKWRRTHEVWISREQIVNSQPLFAKLMER